ncbi:MAG UNVERIFIED_CONTAM: DUF1501 domain-containing protein [Planctomycetaceae bacterium]
MFQAGAPSHLELFDHKPELAAATANFPLRNSCRATRAGLHQSQIRCLGPRFTFQKSGQCGMELSEVLPHTAAIADDICLIRSMQTDAVNHAPAQIFMNTGSQQFGRPASARGHSMDSAANHRTSPALSCSPAQRYKRRCQQLRKRLPANDVFRSSLSQQG